MRNAIHWLALAAVLVAANAMILQKERILKSGTTMLLRLAPVDPRSLMQGDYMVLRYRMSSEALRRHSLADRGKIVVILDKNRVARFARVHCAEKLNAGEHLLTYRKRGELRLGAESFFFQEGKAGEYSGARYGELRVSSGGAAVLVGLRDEKRRRLGK